MTQELTAKDLSSEQAALRVTKAIETKRGLTVTGIHGAAKLGCDIRTFRAVLENPKEKVLSEKDLKALNLYLDVEGLKADIALSIKASDDLPDALYFALVSYLQYEQATVEECAILAPGVYRLYRPSMRIPEAFTEGLFTILENKDTGALCTHEIRYFNPANLEPPMERAKDILATPEQDIIDDRYKKLRKETPYHDEFHGYFFRKRRRYFCFQRAIARDDPNFVFSIFNDEFVSADRSSPSPAGSTKGQQSRIKAMGGISFASRGSKLSVSRIFIERDNPPDEVVKDEAKLSEYEDAIRRIVEAPGQEVAGEELDKLMLTYRLSDELRPSIHEYLKMPKEGMFATVF